MSLFRRIWLTVIGLTIAAFLGSLLVNTLTARSYLEKQLFIKNKDNATALALSMSQQSDKDPVTMELLLSALFDNGHYQQIRLTDPTGKVMVEREAHADSDLGAPAWFVALLPIHADPGVAHITDGWKQYGSISLASHSKSAYRDLWQGTLELTGWFLVGGLLAGVLGTLMLRLITRPLNQVVDQAHAIVERRFISVVEPKVPELRSVVAARGATLMHREGVIRMQTEADGPWHPAGDFMPFAVRLKLTPSLDLGVIRLALEALRKETGNFAVNLSADTFADPDFRKQLVEQLRSHGDACKRLWVEVPEYATVSHFDAFRELCRSLKALGCKVGIENFGRKLAEVDKLADLGVDYVKVDTSFVRDIDRNDGNREFLAGLCKMVHGIGIMVIAVGVRNQQELDTLVALGLDGVTGPAVLEPG